MFYKCNIDVKKNVLNVYTQFSRFFYRILKSHFKIILFEFYSFAYFYLLRLSIFEEPCWNQVITSLTISFFSSKTISFYIFFLFICFILFLYFDSCLVQNLFDCHIFLVHCVSIIVVFFWILCNLILIFLCFHFCFILLVYIYFPFFYFKTFCVISF